MAILAFSPVTLEKPLLTFDLCVLVNLKIFIDSTTAFLSSYVFCFCLYFLTCISCLCSQLQDCSFPTLATIWVDESASVSTDPYRQHLPTSITIEDLTLVVNSVWVCVVTVTHRYLPCRRAPEAASQCRPSSRAPYPRFLLIHFQQGQVLPVSSEVLPQVKWRQWQKKGMCPSKRKEVNQSILVA